MTARANPGRCPAGAAAGHDHIVFTEHGQLTSWRRNGRQSTMRGTGTVQEFSDFTMRLGIGTGQFREDMNVLGGGNRFCDFGRMFANALAEAHLIQRLHQLGGGFVARPIIGSGGIWNSRSESSTISSVKVHSRASTSAAAKDLGLASDMGILS